MREIKFRAWDRLTNSWLDVEEQIGFESNGDGASYLILVDNGGRLAWEQYTGLKDKNGKEIYEGDIWEREGFIATVEFVFSQWNLMYTKKSSSIQYPSFFSNANTGQVIGNIHENPELL